ncbi:MAG: PQQ-binding-like beta-propeller repeat protein [Planctomycetota bacterium]
MRFPLISLAVALVAGSAAALPQDASTPTHWPSYRGPSAGGVASGDAPTVAEWDVESGENIVWKTAIPGLAHSSPVIWGDRIFLTTAISDADAELIVGLYGSVAPVEGDGAQEFAVLCLDRSNGAVLWTRTAWQGQPKFKRHPKGSYAASTPATDGKHVVAFFGTEGLYCYDVEGEQLWHKDLGSLDAGWFVSRDAEWGFGSSPVIHDGRVYIQCDVQENSFVAALDVATGEEIWRTERDEVPTWSSPTVHITPARRQLIVNGWRHAGAYDLDKGTALWQMEREFGGDIPVPTPVVAHGLAFFTSAHGRASPVMAVSIDATGELPLKADDNEHVAWSIRSGGNYMQTPIVYGDELYCCRDMGVLSCFDARTGERHYKKRLDAGLGFTASGVAAAGKLYFTAEPGDVFVVAAGTEYNVLAINELGETCLATPAIAQGTLYFRTRNHLIAIGDTAGN